MLTTGDVTLTPDARALIALSRDGRTVAIATQCDVYVFNALRGNLVECIKDVHSSKCLFTVSERDCYKI